MSHKIKVAFLGEGEILPALVRAVIDRDLVPVENIILSREDAESPVFEQEGASLCADAMNAVVKAEIVVLCASTKRELGTVIAPISGCTRGRIVLAMCPKADLAYVTERVAKGTEVLCAQPTLQEDGTYHATLEFSAGLLPFQAEPCRDIVSAVCVIDA